MRAVPLILLLLCWGCSAEHVIGARGTSDSEGPFGSLFCRTDLPVRFYPTSAVLQDVNGDGRLDLLLAHVYDAVASVWLGRGDGSFTLQGSYGAEGIVMGMSQGTLSDIAVGDVDGDMHPDLVLADVPGHVLLGKGDGSFVPKGSFAGGNPASLVVGDINNDRHLDLVFIDRTTDTVRTLLGDGHGAFAMARDYQAAQSPQTVRAADADGDGWPDLLVTSWNSDSLNLLPSQRDGTFKLPPVSFPVGERPQGLAAVDLDRDGTLDVVVADENSDAISVLLGRRGGGPVLVPQGSYATGKTPVAVAPLDANGDGVPDVVVANENSDTVSLLLGNGDGTFQQQTSYATGVNPTSVAAGDLNGDGRVDFVITNWNSASVSVFLNQGEDGPACPATP